MPDEQEKQPRPTIEVYQEIYREVNADREGFVEKAKTTGLSQAQAMAKYYNTKYSFKKRPLIDEILNKPMLLNDEKKPTPKLMKKNKPIVALVKVKPFTKTSSLCWKMFHKQYRELDEKELRRYWKKASKLRAKAIAEGKPHIIRHRAKQGIPTNQIPSNLGNPYAEDTTKYGKGGGISDKRKILAKLLLNGSLSNQEVITLLKE